MTTAISILLATACSLIFFSILKLLKIRKLKINNLSITKKFKKQRIFYYYLLSIGLVLLLLTIIIALIINLL